LRYIEGRFLGRGDVLKKRSILELFLLDLRPPIALAVLSYQVFSLRDQTRFHRFRAEKILLLGAGEKLASFTFEPRLKIVLVFCSNYLGALLASEPSGMARNGKQSKTTYAQKRLPEEASFGSRVVEVQKGYFRDDYF
jgi:hypothetical protein